MVGTSDVPLDITNRDVQDRTEEFYKLKRVIRYAIVGECCNIPLHAKDINEVIDNNDRSFPSGRVISFYAECSGCHRVYRTGDDHIHRACSNGVRWKELRSLIIEGIDREQDQKMDRIMTALETIAMGVKIGKADVKIEIRDSVIHRSNIGSDETEAGKIDG